MELSIIIPARNEMFLARTIQDILENIEADTEVIAVLDGAWTNPPIEQNERVNVIYLPESIGQRAATNIGVKLAKGKYVMKVDAHCSFDKGFDRKLIEGYKELSYWICPLGHKSDHGGPCTEMVDSVNGKVECSTLTTCRSYVSSDNVTMVPVMRNLHAFDWKCYLCGWTKYQGPTPEKCEQCGKKGKIRHRMRWIGKRRPQSTSYCFDATPHFQYFEDYKHREKYIKDKETGFTETMSIQGSCWMVTKEKYWELNLGDENFGSWGSQGIQVACSTWLSGGRVLINHNTWYAHLFRTQGADFSFPYPQSGNQVARAKQYAKKLLYENGFPKQIHPTSWLLEKFWPVPGWTDEQLKQLKEAEKMV